MIKITAWLMAVSLMASFILIPAKPTFAATVYKYEWVSQSGTVSPDGYAHQYTGLKAGDSIPLSLTLINRSGTTIVDKSVLPTIPGYQVPIGTWGVGTQNPQDGTPYFLGSSSFILNSNRFVYYDGADVPDGGYFTLNWTVKLASNLTDGVYDLSYRPVCEYLAWTRQVKNGYTLPGTNSDIFTRFVVGSGVSSTYLTYTNQQYGFSFDYPQPIPPAQLMLDTDRSQIGNDLLATIIIGVPDTGSANARVFVWSDSNLNNVVAKVESQHPGYAVSYLNLNNISWTVLKGHQDYADANYEVRIGKLPNGYVVESIADGWFNTSPDQRFLNSLKSIATLQSLTNTNMNFTLSYPVGYEAHGVGMGDDPVSYGQIQIYKGSNPHSIIVIDNLEQGPGDSNGFEGMSLYAWATAFRQANIQFAVSSLNSDTLGGLPAYSFTMQGGVFVDAYRHSGDTWPSTDIRKVLLVNNKTGSKLMIAYSINDAVLSQIISTLIFF